MQFATRRCVLRVLWLAALTQFLSTQAAHAQRGGCLGRQQTGSRASQSRLYTPTLSYSLPGVQYGSQAYALQAQQYAVLAQLYATQQQYALQRDVFLAQLDNAPPNGVLSADVLEVQLDDLRDYIADQQQNGQLTRAQLRALRQQEKALEKQLRAARKQTTRSQSRQSQKPTPVTEDP